MIIELKKENFYICKDLINPKGQLEVKAIIEGINPGRIFIDNFESPRSGLIWQGNNDGFYFIGESNNDQFNAEINHFIECKIAIEAKELGLVWFEGFGNHSDWNPTIEELFKHRDLGKWNQRAYKLDKENYLHTNEPVIQQEFKVQKITKVFYESNSMKNNDFLNSKILEFWPTSDDFFENGGIGYVAIYNDEIVSLCFSGFIADNVHGIDIETLSGFRGNKLARKLAHAFVQECLRNDVIPYWDCMEGNKPSVTVAESIGFIQDLSFIGYEFRF
ncbi:GNAT family N-acetyltransferase [Bacillus sp. CGMCC 1.16607]|uniref:GNAT family N-acetyltransferase n=1 Tax=Bacillus sp. CGMCC 1.16607 TaxID=3351842 RepID=UPI00363C7759